MAKVHVSEDIQVIGSIEQVFKEVSDFHNWTSWSPWLITEPDANVTVREDGKYYEWEGKVVGSGNMTVLSEKENEYVTYDLTFLKPWKSKAKVRFDLKTMGEGVKVTWSMDTSLPFFLFWMKKMMSAYIAMDFNRGLTMIKDKVENGSVRSKVEILGNNSIKETDYIYINRSCTFDEMPSVMENDFTELMTYSSNHNEKISDAPFTVYHKWDMVNKRAEFSSCVPYTEIPADLPSTFKVGKRQATKTYAVKHTGPYTFAGNPWSAIYGRQQAKVFKINKKIHPMEIYLNSPKDTPENELQVEIHMPVK